MNADDPRRFLIATGTEHYDDGDQLSSVPEDLRRITEFFGQLGYHEELPKVRIDPISNELRAALSGWLTSSARQLSDTAVIYYSGHGDIQGDSFYMLTADSRVNEYPVSALRADFVLEALGDNPKVRRILLLLDACYSGQGGFDAAAAAARVARLHNWGDGEGVWVVAAAGSKQEAEEAHFVTAFIEAARQLQTTTGKLQPYVSLEWLIEQTNNILKRRGRSQLARYIPVTQATGLAPFIPNPQYEPELPANIDLETRAWLQRQHAAELAGHWAPRARGVEVAVQAGWYFTGRQAALQELASWMADPVDDTRMRMVTGRPGSGKSAVLGRLVTIAGRDPGPAGPDGSPDASPALRIPLISAALLAKGKTAEGLLRELMESLDLDDSEQFPAGLAGKPAFWIVIDALDEASDPLSVVQKVILPLHDAASPGLGPRIVVGTRPYTSLLAALPTARVTIDLDVHPYIEPADVSQYVTKILLSADDPSSRSPYRDRPEAASTAAEEVSRIAGSSFLIAQLAARTLARMPQPLTPAEISANREQWRDVGAAFDRDLARYGQHAQRVRDLLIPLAWSEGAGLPRELWAPLATTLSEGRVYADADVAWLLGEAGSFLVEALDDERSVYRLYHQQFAEHLRAGHRSSTAQPLIAAELLRHVPVGRTGNRDWAAASPYIRTHLATHAAAAGTVDHLLGDPGFLRAAAADRLLPSLHAVATTDGRRAGEAYRRALPWLSQGPSQLFLAALQVGARRLADALAASPDWPPGAWRPSWAWWRRPTPTQTIAELDGGTARAVAVMKAEERIVAVVALPRRIESWDIGRGERLAQRPTSAPVNCITPCTVEGWPAVAVGDSEGHLAILSTASLEQLAGRRHAHPAEIRAIAAVGVPAGIATGDQEGGLALWSLPGLELIARQREAHTWVRHLALVSTGDENLLVSAGDWAPLEEDQPMDIPTLRAWTIPDLQPYASWAEERRLVMFMGVLQTGPPTRVIVNQATNAEIWQLDSRKRRFRLARTLNGVEFSGLLKLDDEGYLIIGVNTMIPLSLKRGQLRHLRLGNPVETEDAHWAGPIDTDQGKVVVSATRLLRSWTVQDLLEESEIAPRSPAGARQGKFTVTCLAAHDDVIYASTLDNSVRAWRAASGATRLSNTPGSSPVSGLAAVPLNDVQHIVIGLEDGQVRLVNSRTGKVAWSAEAGQRVMALRTLSLNGRLVALVAVELGWNLYVCRLWDIASGTEIESRDLGSPGEPVPARGSEWNLAVAGYRRDKSITDLATYDAPDGLLAGVSSHAGVIPVWDLASQRHVAELQTDPSGTSALAFTAGELFAGGFRGELYIWHISPWLAAREDESRQPARRVSVVNIGTIPIFSPAIKIFSAHYGRINALESGTWDAQPCVLSGGKDGRLRSWDLNGEPLAIVDIGEPVTAIAALAGGRYAIGTSRGIVVIDAGGQRTR